MNKLGKGPTLTWIFIGLAIGITALMLSMSSYNSFITDNGVTPSGDFEQLYSNITSQHDSIDEFGSNLQDKGDALAVVKDVALGTLNVFVTGLTTIGQFFGMASLITTIFESAKSAIQGFADLFNLLILVAGVYVVMAIIKARRGTSYEA